MTETFPPLHPIQLGILGLGRAFTLMLPTLKQDSRINLVAGFDPRLNARLQFEHDFGDDPNRANRANSASSAEEVCANPNVEWVYVATPHQFHAEHVELAASHGKHILVEKPMAITIADCTRMIDVCKSSGVHLIIGPSHSFDAPVLQARQAIIDNLLGPVKMMQAFNYTDFLYRPRRPEELDTRQGGGVVFSQGAHQIDILRLLGGGVASSLRASTGQWDENRPTEGAYSALIQFANGLFASASYNGYGYYDSDVLMDWVGEMGQAKARNTHANNHKNSRLLREKADHAESIAKAERNYGGSLFNANLATPATIGHQHFGFMLVSCEHGDIRITPKGLEIYDHSGQRDMPCLPNLTPRATVIDELWRVARLGEKPLHSGEWSRATLEICLAILESNRTNGEIALHYQVAP
jgi:phthalate 4,5-cis-dihydrodiol dehydrogenase